MFSQIETQLLHSLQKHQRNCTEGTFGNLGEVERNGLTAKQFQQSIESLKQKGVFEFIDKDFSTGQYCIDPSFF